MRRKSMRTPSVCDLLHAACEPTSPPRRSQTSSTPIGKPRRRPPYSNGFGGLFLLAFAGRRAAEAFYDALACAKGPSLGTNFTLACPYTILAHYWELDLAAQYGVPASLVRVSIGLEDAGWLHKVFADALKAAEDAHRAETNAGA